MNLIFDTTLSKLILMNSDEFNEKNYLLTVSLSLVHYDFDDDEFQHKNEVSQYLKNIKNTNYSEIQITDGNEGSGIWIKDNFIEISSSFKQEKLLKLYEILKDEDVKKKFVRINITNEELDSIKTSYGMDKLIYFTIFKNINFEFQYE